MPAGISPLEAYSPSGRQWPAGVFSFTENPQAIAAAIVHCKTADPNCVGIIFHNLGAQPVVISTSPTPTLSTGFLLPVNGEPFIITGKDLFQLPQLDWYAISNVTGTTLQVAAIARIG